MTEPISKQTKKGGREKSRKTRQPKKQKSNKPRREARQQRTPKKKGENSNTTEQQPFKTTTNFARKKMGKEIPFKN